MVRRRTPVLLQVYLTTGLFVIVSWISFIVPPEVVPGKTTHFFITNKQKQTNIRYCNIPKKGNYSFVGANLLLSHLPIKFQAGVLLQNTQYTYHPF